ncbi:autotransporter outer membrane beta-barrel domain-containing protein [Tritonibacter mobilis]|uniref:autotransporter outer membrane beta-barrel domain-containing protein n=1 Tax=Tritonibacter mobilis TaxID=379347 RepID=UPI001403C4F5|nr:autotransporter outer membrane beta-barrel domain-containing protein [Tritonibacter mobilis]NHM19876.1 autotransporter outer membrane beta-barrel domain-containing protein [Tritonibacter mobilis]NHM24057.1 autotransporter outer membrane beta-barrel domain-containing protein [Tritonibacter mobilis]
MRNYFSTGAVIAAMKPSVAILATSGAAIAGTYEWQNPTGGALTDAGNWSPVGVPGSTDDIRFGTLGGAPVGTLMGSTIDLGFGSMLLEGGRVDVGNGGSLATGVMQIGQSAGANGTLSVEGSGTVLNMRGATTIGGNGTGTLTFSDGAMGYGNLTRVGESSGGNGSLRITDGATFLNADDMHVGLAGTGDLQIGTLGYLSSRNGSFGYYTAGVGTGNISGAFGRWDISGTLTLGRSGSGQLEVENGGVVASAETMIGYGASGSGGLSLSNGGQAYVSGNTYVGWAGSGELSISDGSFMTTDRLIMAVHDGSAGEVTITGPWSQMTSTNLVVGERGTGQMTISDQGTFNTGPAWLGYFGNGAGTLTVSDGGSYRSSDDLYMGLYGHGALNVSGGGQVENRLGGVGWFAGAQGAVVVSDTGSLWNMSGNMIVGREGAGSLLIENGGEVRAGGETTLGALDGSTGSATVTGSGSLWDINAPLLVGREGDGTLLIDDGGRVENTTSYVAYTFGSTSAVSAENGGTWAQSDDAYIGFGGSGALTVESSGKVSSRDFILGYHGVADGRAHFSGVGTELNNTGRTYIGLWGDGEIIAENGAALSSVSGSVGVQPGSVGSVVLSGAGTTWDTSDYFVVGRSGSGTALIEGGAALTTKTGLIASNPTSVGQAVVTDTGSVWSMSDDLRLGPQGDGMLTVANDGHVEIAGDLLIGEFAGSTATLNIGGANGSGAMTAGTVDTSRVIFGDGTGTINFNHTDPSYQFDADILGTGSLNLQSGTTDLRGDTSGFTGLTHVATGARLTMSRDMSLDALLLNGGVADFSAASPSAHTLTLRGSFGNAGLMDMQNATAGDNVSVSGNYIGGGVIGVDVDFSNDTADTLSVAGDISGAPTQLLVADVSSGMASGQDVVLASALGHTQAGDFVLGQPVSSGAFRYDLDFQGGSHVLSASFLPVVAGIEGIGPAMFYHGDLPRLRERFGVGSSGQAVSIGDGVTFWSSFTDSKRRFATSQTSTGYQADMQSTTFRAGLRFETDDFGPGRLSFGSYFGIGQSGTDLLTSTSTAQIDLDSNSFGLSATWRQSNGFYIDTVVQASDFEAEITAQGPRTKVSGRGFSTGLETGKSFALAAERWTLTPQARLEYQTVELDPYTTANGLQVAGMSGRSLTASIGGSMEYDLINRDRDSGLKLYGALFATRQWDGAFRTNAGGTPLTTHLAPWAGEVTLGAKYDAGSFGGFFVETTLSGNPEQPSQDALTLRAGAQIRF